MSLRSVGPGPSARISFATFRLKVALVWGRAYSSSLTRRELLRRRHGIGTCFCVHPPAGRLAQRCVLCLTAARLVVLRCPGCLANLTSSTARFVFTG